MQLRCTKQHPAGPSDKEEEQMIPAAVRKTDQKKYALQINQIQGVSHISVEKHFSLHSRFFPWKITIRPYKWKPLVTQLHLFHNWLLQHVLPLPGPSVSHFKSTSPPAAFLPSFHPKASGCIDSKIHELCYKLSK